MKKGIVTVGETAIEIHGEQRSYGLRAGGAAVNVAVISASLGMEAICIGKAGRDAMGTLLTQLAHGAHLHTDFVYSRTASTCVSLYTRPDAVPVTLGNANHSFTPKELYTPLAAYLTRSKYMYVGGSASLTRMLPHLTPLLRYAVRLGTIPVIDPGYIPADLSGTERDYIIKALPQAELCICRKESFLHLWQTHSIDEAFSRLRNIAVCNVIIYDEAEGAQGMQVTSRITVPFPRKRGLLSALSFDAFTAGVLRAMDRDLRFRDVLKVGCTVASVSMSQRSVPTIDEVQHTYDTTYTHISL